MSDVAKLAGVGTMTVSRVINGHQHVTEEMRRRVFEAVEKLNYRPNEVARSLREQRSRQIGVIVPNIHDPFFAVCAQAVSTVAKEQGYSVNIAMSYEDPETEYNEAAIMLRRHVEGLVVIPSAGPVSRLTEPEFASTPVVTLDRPIAGSRFDSVVVQNQSGARIAVHHLIEHGHQRIGYLGLSSQIFTLNARFKGYQQAIRRAGLMQIARYGNATQEEMLSTMRMLLAGRDAPTALFCSNNLITRHALHALSELKIQVPEKIALVGFDDFETADLLKPTVTVIRQSATEMGRIGASMLFSHLAGEEAVQRATQVVLPVELIVRRSCGSHPLAGTGKKTL